MAKKKEEFVKQDEQLEEVNEALTGAGKWIEDNANLISWIVCGIAVVVMAIIAINNYIIKPKALEASNENAKAVVYFMAGDFDKALAGDDAECIGFEAIADEYGHYQQGKLAALYAGICYYEKGEYEDAAKYLKKFDADDLNIDPAASQLLGDAYVELGEYSKAAKAFEAAAESGNEIIAPTDKGVYFSTSSGRTWLARCTSSDARKFTCLQDGGRELLAMTSDGHLYFSTSSGRTWLRRR
jgi:tetratricopeptide (TPR) repeat protein